MSIYTYFNKETCKISQIYKGNSKIKEIWRGTASGTPQLVYQSHVHNYEYQSSTVGDDCQTTGYNYYKCSCGASKSEVNYNYGPHSLVYSSSVGTGMHEVHCRYCDYSFIENCTPSSKYYHTGGYTHYRKCELCGGAYEDPVQCTFSKPVFSAGECETNSWECEYCGAVSEGSSTSNHSFSSNGTGDPHLEYCENCGAWRTTDHNYVTISGAGSCDQENSAYTGLECSICGDRCDMEYYTPSHYFVADECGTARYCLNCNYSDGVIIHYGDMTSSGRCSICGGWMS